LSILTTLLAVLGFFGLGGAAASLAIILLFPIIPTRWCGAVLGFTWGLLVISLGAAVLLVAAIGVGLAVSLLS